MNRRAAFAILLGLSGFLAPLAIPLPGGDEAAALDALPRGAPALGLADDSSGAQEASDGASDVRVTATEMTAPRETPGGQPLGAHPFEGVLGRALSDSDLTPDEFGHAVREYFAALGFGVPDAIAAETIFDENNTISFSYDLGDVNGDGTDDVALDMYCVTTSGCPTRIPSLTSVVNYLNYLRGGSMCGLPHRVSAVSGVDGSTIWSRRIDQPRMISDPSLATPALLSCTQEFVVGTLPVPGDRHGVLMYRLAVVRPLFVAYMLQLEHEYYLLDPLDGRKVWSHAETGLFVADPFASVIHAENLLVNPILQVPPRGGARLIPESTQPALFLQGVGFDATGVASPVVVPGHNGAFPLLDVYWPNEWAAKIDTQTGVATWNVTTFTPQAETSVLPFAINAAPPIDPARNPTWQAEYKGRWYWNHQPCCFDSTGDGVPDLVYWTREWSTMPSTNAPGPYMQRVRALLWDGATGAPLWDVDVEPNSQKERTACRSLRLVTCLEPYPQLVGDATGDGKADVLMHLLWYDADYTHTLSLYSGADGDEVWRRASPKNLQALVLGDVDGDGGNDVVTFEYHNQGTWFVDPYSYDAANVTDTLLTVRSGSSGAPLWTVPTHAAPADVAVLFDTYRTNGVPDLDADGVGDFPVDDPIYYPDQTVVHRQTFLSGRSGEPIHRVTTVGGFAFPSYAGDLTGDGVHDLAILNGDVNDLWVTAYDGSDGDALWSRRVMTLRNANYIDAVARQRTHVLGGNGTVGDSILLNLHFRLTTQSGAVLTATNTPQLAAFRGLSGESEWSLPVLAEADFTTVIDGATPLTAKYLAAYETVQAGWSLAEQSAAARVGLALALFAPAAAAGYAATQWRRNK